MAAFDWPLWQTVADEDVTALQALLSTSRRNVALAKPLSGETILAKSANASSEEAALTMCLALLDASASLRRPDHIGTLPIHVACRRGYSSVVAAFLARDEALLEARGPLRLTPLMMAAGSPRTVEVLLEAGADVEAASPTGERALHRAARATDATSAAALLRAGADHTAVDSYGRSALWTACRSGAAKVVLTLVRCAASLSARALHDVEVFAEPTFLGGASLTGDVVPLGEEVRITRDPPIEEAERGSIVAFYALADGSGYLPHIDVDRRAADNIVVFSETTRPSYDGTPPVVAAAGGPDDDDARSCLEALSAAGTSIDEPAAMMAACRSGHLLTAKLLHKHGVSVVAKYRGETALSAGISSGIRGGRLRRWLLARPGVRPSLPVMPRRR